MDLASKSLYYLCADSCRCHLEAAGPVIHHTLSFSPVINIVIGWTRKLPGGREHGSPLGGSGSSASHRHGDQRVFRSDSPEHVSSAWIPIPVSLRSPGSKRAPLPRGLPGLMSEIIRSGGTPPHPRPNDEGAETRVQPCVDSAERCLPLVSHVGGAPTG